MANFEFSKKEFKLQILGMMFSIPDNVETSEKLMSFGEKMQHKAKTVKEENQKQVLDECCNECYELFDNLLGTNASNKIFKDREMNVFDCIELMNFIASEIDTQRTQRLKKYSNERINRKPNDYKKKR